MAAMERKASQLSVNWKNSKSFGFRRRFGIAGLFNALITNLVLFISLYFVSPLLATLSSQVVNTTFGYVLYSKNVFFKEIYPRRFVTHYLLTSSIVWLTNYGLILFFCTLGTTKPLAAVLAIPFVATLSFLLQKYFVFNY